MLLLLFGALQTSAGPVVEGSHRSLSASFQWPSNLRLVQVLTSILIIGCSDVLEASGSARTVAFFCVRCAVKFRSRRPLQSLPGKHGQPHRSSGIPLQGGCGTANKWERSKTSGPVVDPGQAW